MQPRRTPLSLAFALALATGLAAPQFVLAAGTGTLTGHIERQKDHQPLSGAQVMVKETGARVVTGPDGLFQFSALAAGEYTLVTSLAGAAPVETRVSVADGGTTSRDVLLAGEVSALEQVTILGQRTTELVARAAEQEAPNLVNLTTIEEMLKLPDVNTGEAVRRIPGISLETDTGEGRFINIRGLDSDLNSTTFGGLRLPPTNNASPFGGGRAVAFDSIPTGFVGAITVTKSNLPEQDAEALGGTIDITPKTVPADGKPFGNIRLGSGYEPERKTGIADLTATAGGKFGGEKQFSLILTGTYYEDKRGINDVEAGYVDGQPTVPDKAFSALEQRWYQYHRKRHGYGFDLGFQPDGVSKYFLRYYDMGYSETVDRQRMVLNFAGNATVDPANPNGLIDTLAASADPTKSSVDKTLRDEKEFIDSKVFELGGKNHFGDSVLDYHVGWTQGKYYKPYDLNTTFSNYTPANIVYDNTSNPNHPVYSISGLNPLDPSGYTLAGIGNSSTSTRDREWGIGTNLSMPEQWLGGTDEELKLGLNARLRDRNTSGSNWSYDTSSLSALTLAQVASGGNVNFYNGWYQNGPPIDVNAMRGIAAGLPVSVDQIASASQFAVDKEDVYAAYGQYTTTFGRLGLVGGLRVEETHGSYTSTRFQFSCPYPYTTVQCQNNNNLEVEQASGLQTSSHSYADVFPSLQARYEFSHDLIGRAAVSSSIARPGFNQVNASTVVDPGANTATTGNPNLKPARATSLDLQIADYLPHAGVLSFGLFDKEITDYIVNNSVSNNGVFAELTPSGRILTYGNAPHSHAMGLEFNYVQRLRDLLPGPFGGLGLSANYTYVDSRFEIRPGENMQMPSTSKDTYNLELMYETPALDATLGAYYVSKNLFAIGHTSALDTWSQPRFSMDFGSQYKVDKNLKLHLNVKNLTDTPLKFTEGPSQDRPIQREFYGITILAGFSYDL